MNLKSRLKTAVNDELHWFDIQFSRYGIESILRQIGLSRLVYKTELPNLLLVGASAGYSRVSGAIAHEWYESSGIINRGIYSAAKV